ncbi:MAG: hypothetical protein J6C85_06920 [Alphaproteobacteria bacterium]|nr:hypothetical protein [Alphaproteobacteria bacterium]
MIEYVDAFREEAKSLFSAYKNNEQGAVTRCAKVFGDKIGLTLMNIQHFIAKEYGIVKTGDFRRGIGVMVNPLRLIEMLGR